MTIGTRLRLGIILIGLVVLLGGLLLIGCGSKSESTEVAPPGAAEQEATAPETGDEPAGAVHLLVSNHFTNEIWQTVFYSHTAQYEAEHPDVILEQIATDFNNLMTRVASDRMADDPPDIYQLPGWWTGNLVASDILAEVPPDIVADVQANYPPGVIQGLTWDGKIWGVPLETQATIMVYNIAMLKEAGYDRPPETLDELKEYARNLTVRDADGNVVQYGYSQWIGDQNTEYLPFASLLYSNGGRVFDDEGKQPLFNSPEGIEVLTLQTDLIQEGVFDPELTFTDWIGNRVAITILPLWARILHVAYGDPSAYGAAPVPHGEGHASGAIVYVWFMGVNKRSDSVEQAWDFVRWFTQEPMGEGLPTHAAQLYSDIASIAPSRAPDREVMADLFATDMFPAFVEALEYGRIPVPVPQYEEIQLLLNSAIESAWFGQKTPQEALDDAAAEVYALLNMP